MLAIIGSVFLKFKVFRKKVAFWGDFR
jgi:hypothetical protein